MGVELAAVPHAVAEPGVDQLDAELLHKQQDVVVHRWDTRRYGDVERDRAAIVLRHVCRNRVPADLRLGLEQPEVEAVGVVAQRPRRAQPRNAPAHNGNSPHHRAYLAS